MRLLFWIHRWTGIAVGVMTLVWFVSGMVVHWYAFVDATDRQVLGGYGAPLTSRELHGIGLPNQVQLGQPLRRSVLHHLARQLVWETETTEPGVILTDARSGIRRPSVTLAEATEIAGQVVQRSTVAARGGLISEPDAYYYEQSFRYEFSDQQSLPFPAYRVAFTGPHSVSVYVDPATGRVAAVVGTRQRITRLFGTMPHFLNPSLFHGHATLHLVIMLAFLLGAFVSGVSGLVYGVWFLWRQRRARASGSGERQRALRRVLADWHNWIGVAVGAFVVTWAVSGVLMLWYPEVTPARDEIDRMEAGTIRPADYRVSPESALSIVSGRVATPVAALQARRLVTRPVYDARHTDGRSTLVDGVTGAILSPLSDSLVRAVVRTYAGEEAMVRSIAYVDHYDAYYYDLHGRLRPLPVYRVDLRDPRDLPSPLYIDALRGELVGRVNRDYRTFRWYGSAIHTMDFPLLFFHQTMWHVVLMGLALLGTLLSASGLWLGFLYLGRALPIPSRPPP